MKYHIFYGSYDDASLDSFDTEAEMLKRYAELKRQEEDPRSNGVYVVGVVKGDLLNFEAVQTVTEYRVK